MCLGGNKTGPTFFGGVPRDSVAPEEILANLVKEKGPSLLDLLDQKQRTKMCMNLTGIWKIISVWSEGQVVWRLQLDTWL